MTRRARTQVELPTTLVDDIQDVADLNGVTVASLCYHWISSAARLAAQGRGELLPRAGQFGGLSREHSSPVSWLQGTAERRRFRALIEDAGSTFQDVLRVAGYSYVEARGDAVLMSWPPKSELAGVA